MDPADRAGTRGEPREPKEAAQEVRAPDTNQSDSERCREYNYDRDYRIAQCHGYRVAVRACRGAREGARDAKIAVGRVERSRGNVGEGGRSVLAVTCVNCSPPAVVRVTWAPAMGCPNASTSLTETGYIESGIVTVSGLVAAKAPSMGISDVDCPPSVVAPTSAYWAPESSQMEELVEETVCVPSGPETVTCWGDTAPPTESTNAKLTRYLA